jgi:hypothetical protein
MPRRAQAGLLAVAVIAAAFWLWRTYGTPDERAIRGRLDALAIELNASTADGVGTALRAARLGHYFTDDVLVELGPGSPPIRGRETLMAMASRLRPRTSAFEVDLDDVTVDVLDGTRADVTLTALIRRRIAASGEESLDAREFSATLEKSGGEWRIARVTAVDTLR